MVPALFAQRQPLLRAPDAAKSLALWALALAAARWAGPGGILYWDSFGYVGQSLTGDVGGLLLGRPLFILASHGVARAVMALGLAPDQVEALLRALWAAVSALAAPATATLVARLAPRPDGPAAPASLDASTLAGLLVALSPAAANTADAVLTDGPSMAFATLGYALAAHTADTRGRSLAAGLCLGAAAGLREHAIVHLPLVMALRALVTARRTSALWVLLGAIPSGALGVVWAFATQADYLARIRSWFAAMGAERRQHPWGPLSLAFWAAWMVALGPVALFGTLRFWRDALRATHSRAILLCAGTGGAQLLALSLYQDIAFSPRYLLAAFPTGLALPAALAFAPTLRSPRGRAALLLALVLPVALAPITLARRQGALRDALAETPSRLRDVAPNAIVVSGQACPAVVLTRTTTRLRGTSVDWRAVCPGWRWPGNLPSHLDALRAEGRPLVVDLRAAVWVGPRQRACRDAVERYLQSQAPRHDGHGLALSTSPLQGRGRPKSQKPAQICYNLDGLLREKPRRRSTLPQSHLCSTIDPGRLDDRVRDGIG